MYPTLLRHALFPALDVLNRTEIARTLAFLERSQWSSAADLAALQDAKLDAILAWAGTEAPFYREHWRRASADRRATSAYPALDGMPIVTKEDLRPHLAEFPVRAYRGRVLTLKTSGSTGEPMTYLRSAEQESWFWALRFRMWQWGGYVLGEPYLTLNLNSRTALKKRLQDVLLRCAYHGFNANQHDVDAVLRDFRRQGIRHLVGYASSLYLLCRAIRERGAAVPRLRTVLATGDTLFPHYRETIEDVLGVGVVDYYGAGGEGFHLASQCEWRGEYHLHPENAVVEVLRDGRPARPGELGEVVVTQLDNRAMPLVRYATRDLAVPSASTSCPCGRQLALLDSVQGRVPDVVFAPDGSALVVHFFTILFEHLPGIRQFQIVQRETDRIEASVVPAADYARGAVEMRVRDAVARATHGSLAVDFRYVDDIPLSRSGKRRFVRSEVMPDGFGAFRAAADGAVSALRSGR